MAEAVAPNGKSVEPIVPKPGAPTPREGETSNLENNNTPPGANMNDAPKKRPRKKGPNYALMHRKPLPLEVHPLPAFHPTNPISLLQLAYTYLFQLLAPPASHPPERYTGYFSSQTRSVHVTNPEHIRALWEMGFFGKGSLSRSELTWLDREKARLKAKRAGGGGTAEEATNARREERKLKKMERARAEAEKIERQRLIEEGKLDATALETSDTNSILEEATTETTPLIPESAETTTNQRPNGALVTDTEGTKAHETGPSAEDDEDPPIQTQEHLQLTLEESFFLSYALGVLTIPNLPTSSTPSSLLPLFAAHSTFPPTLPPPSSLPPADSPFLISYAVYHHFRSLGWVVRSGIKFSVDYLLYLRGPVFSHAEFAILIIPSYTHPYWSTPEGAATRRIKKDREAKDWWWLHCVNRVQSQVLKSLVLVYVDVPPVVPRREPGGDVDAGKLLRGYRVREFIVKRWVANRSRD